MFTETRLRLYLDRFSPQNEEGLSTLCQKASKLVDQDVFNLVGLFDLDADSDAVDTRLNQDLFAIVSSNGERI